MVPSAAPALLAIADIEVFLNPLVAKSCVADSKIFCLSVMVAPYNFPSERSVGFHLFKNEQSCQALSHSISPKGRTNYKNICLLDIFP